MLRCGLVCQYLHAVLPSTLMCTGDMKEDETDEMPTTKGIDEAIIKVDRSDCESDASNDLGGDLSGDLSSNLNSSLNISMDNGFDNNLNNLIHNSFESDSNSLSGQYLSQDKNIMFDSSGIRFDNTLSSLAAIEENEIGNSDQYSDSSSVTSNTHTKSNINRFRKLAATPKTRHSSLGKETDALQNNTESMEPKQAKGSSQNVDRFRALAAMTPKTRNSGIDADLKLRAADFRSKYGWFERSKKNRSNRLNNEIKTYLSFDDSKNNNINNNGNNWSFNGNDSNNNAHSNDSWTQQTDNDANSLLFPQEIPNIGNITTSCTDAAKSRKYRKAKEKSAKDKISLSQTFVENERLSFVNSCLQHSKSQVSRRSTRLANNKNKKK